MIDKRDKEKRKLALTRNSTIYEIVLKYQHLTKILKVLIRITALKTLFTGNDNM